MNNEPNDPNEPREPSEAFGEFYLPGSAFDLFVERGRHLLDQKRYADAEKEFRRALAEIPDDPLAATLLALALGGQERYTDALSTVHSALGQTPDYPFGHFIAGYLFEAQNKHKPAERALKEALRLAPEFAAAHTQLAQVYASQARWRDCLAAAERSLEIESEDVDATNLRALALRQLKRDDAAAAALHTALSLEPENATTHANQGWAYLQRKKPREAMTSFREALRLNPESETAREGILASLRARNALYRVILGYFFSMQRLTPTLRYAVVFGLVIGRRLLEALTRSNPELKPITTPLIIAYILFVLFSWTADPLFNLLLRFDPVARHVLNRRQVRAANWVGLTLWSVIGWIAAWLFTHIEGAVVCGALNAFLLIPVGATVQASSPTMAKILGVLTGLLVLVLLALTVIAGMEQPLAVAIWAGTFAAGIILFLLLVRRPQ